MQLRKGLFLLLPALTAGTAWAQPAVQVADLNTKAPFSLAAPIASDVVPLSGGRLFFLQGTFTGVPAVTDGRSTEQLADLFPDPGVTRFAVVGRLGDLALFLAGPGNRSPQLFRSDGTRAGTFSLGIAPGDLGVGATRRPNLAGGRLFFLGCPPPRFDCALWQSDGSRAGTGPVPGSPALSAFAGAQITEVGRRAFFVAGDGTAGRDLWVSDGTAAGTARVRSLGAAAPRLLTGAASRLYFLATLADGREQLWTSDGTPSGTRPLTAFARGALLATHWIATAGDRAYLVADDVVAGGAGAEIWASDGTPAGTRRITDLGYFAPFDEVTKADRLQEIGGRLVFPASDGLHGLLPWASSGTPGSTVLLAPVHLDAASPLVRVGSRVVFSAVGEAGDEIWSTDGTPAGTRRLALSCPGSCDPSRLEIVPLLGAAFFTGYDRAHGVELWSTDGTPAGTRRFTDGIPDDTGRSPLAHLAASSGRLFFTLGEAFSGSLAGDLWTSDGQPGGTRPVPPDATTSGAGSEPRELTALGDRLFFTACDGAARQLYESDGTAAGTVARTALSPSPTGCQDDRLRGLAVISGGDGSGGALFYVRRDAGSTGLWRLTLGGDPQPVATFDFPFDLSSPVPFGGEVFFEVFSSSSTAVNSVWRSDGTAAGTRPDPNLASLSQVYGLAAAPGALYVAGLSPETQDHFQIWRTDGPIGGAGTAKLLDLPPSASILFPLVTAGSASLFFTPFDETTARLWRTDGTAAGTVPVHDFAYRIGGPPAEPTLVGDRLYFFADTPTGRGLWRSDGTPAGTVLLLEVPHPGLDASGGIQTPLLGLTPYLGRLFFAADDGVHGRELWQSDGTAEGTALFADLNPGPGSSEIDHLKVASSRLFFSAFDPLDGDELWQSDGTPTGTHRVADVAPESASAAPDQLTAVAGRLFFTADDGLSGRELWTVAPAAACQPRDTRLCLAGGRFAVEIAWKDFQGGSGAGHAVPLTADTGYFWFFAPANVETVVKVLDARSLNQAFWVFYGALSSVEYTITVTDTATGLTRRYFNPSGQLASVGDTNGFGPLGAFDTKAAEAPASGLPLVAARTDARAVTAVCAPAPGRLCLQGGRFAVTAAWKDFSGHTGSGTAVPLTGDTGYFWFFNAANVEVVAKVLDGRVLNGKFWFFYGALSNVEYTLTVTDTQTGAVKTYRNPLGQFGSVADTGAF